MFPKYRINREEAFAYITNQDRLLVFRHTHQPEAGIQVPGGLIKPGETPRQAALRKASEETGLSGLIYGEYLGYSDVDLTPYGKSKMHRRHFFHILLPGSAPERWTHLEEHPSDESSEPVEFEFYWCKLPDQVPELMAKQDVLIGGITLGPKH